MFIVQITVCLNTKKSRKVFLCQVVSIHFAVLLKSNSMTAMLHYIFCQVVSSPLRKSPLVARCSPVRIHKWSFHEERALVEFVGLAKMDPRYGICSKTQWPAFRAGHQFWRDTALHIQESTCSSVLLTSKLFVIWRKKHWYVRDNSDIMYQDWLSPYQLYDNFNLYLV